MSSLETLSESQGLYVGKLYTVRRLACCLDLADACRQDQQSGAQQLDEMHREV